MKRPSNTGDFLRKDTLSEKKLRSIIESCGGNRPLERRLLSMEVGVRSVRSILYIKSQQKLYTTIIQCYSVYIHHAKIKTVQ